MHLDRIREVAGLVGRARSVVVLTGAGVSAESGVPTFRGADGLWRSFRAQDLATPEAFARDPRLVWAWYRWRRGLIRAVEPNPAHLVLARLENRLTDLMLVTQNVDGLHQRAGSRQVLELHGNIWKAACWARCGLVVDQSADMPAGTLDPEFELPTCRCGALLRPGVVWFGESLDPGVVDRAIGAAEACDVLVVIGTSALVYPAAALPAIARRAGAVVVEINLESTPITPQVNFVLRGPAGRILLEVERCL